MFSAQLYTYVQVIVIASTLALPTSTTKKTFSAIPLTHKLFNNSVKCTNVAYREIFSQLDDVAVARAHKFFLSQVVVVGKVLSCQIGSSTNASIDCEIDIDCYLRGKFASSEILLRDLGPNRDERCFDTPSSPLQQGDTVLVFGNVGQDQKSLHPIDGGISKLTENDALPTSTYAGLRCSEESTFSIAKKSLREEVIQFCHRIPMNECINDIEDVNRARDSFQNFRWNDLRAALRKDVKLTNAMDIAVEAYVSKNYKQSVVRERISSAGFPKSAVLRGADGNVVFESASVQQVKYVLTKLGVIGRIMNMLKHELDVQV